MTKRKKKTINLKKEKMMRIKSSYALVGGEFSKPAKKEQASL